MIEHPNEMQPNNPSPKRHGIDQDPIPENDERIVIPGDPLEVDPGKDENITIGDDDDNLGTSHERPHTTTTPSAFHDGIRDGDRDAFDDIMYNEEDDFPRTHP